MSHNEFRDHQSPSRGVRLCLDILPLHPTLDDARIESRQTGEGGALELRGKLGLQATEVSLSLPAVPPDRLDVLARVGAGYLNAWGADGRRFSAPMGSRLRRDLRRAARHLRGSRPTGLIAALVSALGGLEAPARGLWPGA